jgi:hypothetical protein
MPGNPSQIRALRRILPSWVIVKYNPNTNQKTYLITPTGGKGQFTLQDD